MGWPGSIPRVAGHPAVLEESVLVVVLLLVVTQHHNLELLELPGVFRSALQVAALRFRPSSPCCGVSSIDPI
jgi:hypothetical protein